MSNYPFDMCPTAVTSPYPCHILSFSPFFLQHQSVNPCSLQLVAPVNSYPTHMCPLSPLLTLTLYHHPPLPLFAPVIITSTSPTLPFLHLPASHSCPKRLFLLAHHVKAAFTVSEHLHTHPLCFDQHMDTLLWL